MGVMHQTSVDSFPGGAARWIGAAGGRSFPRRMSFAFPFQDPDLPDELRIDSLLREMTREEKISALSTRPDVPRLGVRGSDHVEGLHGLSQGGPGKWGGDDPAPTTTFPQAIGLGMTWEPELVRRVAEVEAHEARYLFQNPRHSRGGIVVRAPNADLGRDLRWGRTEECYGEDAFLVSRLAVAFIRGLQGEHPRYWTAAALMKHFLANSNEDGRESSSSDFDAALFHEYYAAPFRAGVVLGGSRAYMAAYNARDGTPCTVHPMLRDITVREWGQDGIICTDGGAFKMLVTHHRRYPDLVAAAAPVLHAGINQFLDDHVDSVRAALEQGALTEADIDACLRGVYRVMLRLGLLDPAERVPPARIGMDGEPEPWLSQANRDLVREVTRRSVVLLKNEGSLLPLDPARLRRVALIGPRADEVLLDWYSGVPAHAVSPREGLLSRLGEAVLCFDPGDDPARAAALARECDIAILCVGNRPVGAGAWAKVDFPSEGREAVDRQSIDLEQEPLIQAVHAANPRCVVVLISSFPFAINWTQEHVPAILHLAQNSQELGHALADVLFGDIDPSGRLVQTWPRSLDQLPPMMDYDLRHGRTYAWFRGEPLYPFGHGLSYTSFEYGELRLEPAAGRTTPTVRCTVRNTGARRGAAVPQIYVAPPDGDGTAPTRAPLALRGFAKVFLDPGEELELRIALDPWALAHFDIGRDEWIETPGRYTIMLAADARQPLRSASWTITAERRLGRVPERDA